MSFRPSVLPDRDNDILSTFTRSFERARQLVRQDQADTRAQQLHDLSVRERQQELEDRQLDFDLKVAQDPGLEFRQITPQQADLANALGANTEGAAVAPRVFGRRIPMPEDVLPAGTPQDVQIVGERGGRTLTFSQAMADRIARDRQRQQAEFEETLPAARRERQTANELERSVDALLSAGEVTTRSGQPVTPDMVPSTEFGRDLIEDQRASEAALERGVAVRGTPTSSTGGSGRSPDQIRLGQARGRILSAFNRRLADVQREINGMDMAERRIRERMGPPIPTVDRAEIMRAAVREVQSTGDITSSEAEQMVTNIQALLDEAGGGAGGSGGSGGGGGGEPAAGPMTEAEVNQVISILNRAGAMTPEEARSDLEAEGFLPDEIDQILAAMGG